MLRKPAARDRPNLPLVLDCRILLTLKGNVAPLLSALLKALNNRIGNDIE